MFDFKGTATISCWLLRLTQYVVWFKQRALFPTTRCRADCAQARQRPDIRQGAPRVSQSGRGQMESSAVSTAGRTIRAGCGRRRHGRPPVRGSAPGAPWTVQGACSVLACAGVVPSCSPFFPFSPLFPLFTPCTPELRPSLGSPDARRALQPHRSVLACLIDSTS